MIGESCQRSVLSPQQLLKGDEEVTDNGKVILVNSDFQRIENHFIKNTFESVCYGRLDT